ncbi:MAG: medium chain dehydrogenase/reductase family protein [Anaerolineales bacterium]|jgi:NADPH:quinone reductase-like Zn-dependent oxidoreductase
MKYRHISVPKRGGPEVLQVVENDLRSPAAGEVRVKVLAAPVSLPDVEARYGRTPFPPKLPFVPGYAIVGDVDATGEGVTAAGIGERVAALTAYGGYSEYVYLSEAVLIPVPAAIDPVKAAPLILNYIVAYQTMHRSANISAGDKALIIGASGGIGTAFLQLGELAGLEMYGLASKGKHQILVEYGAVPIDYRTQDFVEVIRKEVPEGLDAVFDGIGGDYIRRGFSLLRRGGVFVGFANPISLSRTFRYLAWAALYTLLPNGKRVKYYGTGSSRLNRRPFLEDWAVLFKLLEEGKIDPIIMKTYPLLEAAQANALLESGQVVGNIVLVAPELLLKT